MPPVADLWLFLPLGYLLTVLLETPVLVLGLSPPHTLARRSFCGLWLTACTYPIVVLVLPMTVWPLLGYRTYVLVAEIFAPLAECLIFWYAFGNGPQITRGWWIRDMTTIVAANLTSYLVGAAIIDKWWQGTV